MNILRRSLSAGCAGVNALDADRTTASAGTSAFHAEPLDGLPVRLPMEAVNSSGIRLVRYDERTRTLDVAYTNSGEYRYFDVGPEQLLRLLLSSQQARVARKVRTDIG